MNGKACICLIGLAGLGFEAVAQAQTGEQCVSYLRDKKLQMAQAARQSKVYAEDMASYPDENRVQETCRPQSTGPGNQETTQVDAVHMYRCAYNAYAVALSEAKRGVDCQTAMKDGMGAYPPR